MLQSVTSRVTNFIRPDTFMETIKEICNDYRIYWQKQIDSAKLYRTRII